MRNDLKPDWRLGGPNRLILGINIWKSTSDVIGSIKYAISVLVKKSTNTTYFENYTYEKNVFWKLK